MENRLNQNQFDELDVLLGEIEKHNSEDVGMRNSSSDYRRLPMNGNLTFRNPETINVVIENLHNNVNPNGGNLTMNGIHESMMNRVHPDESNLSDAFAQMNLKSGVPIESSVPHRPYEYKGLSNHSILADGQFSHGFQHKPISETYANLNFGSSANSTSHNFENHRPLNSKFVDPYEFVPGFDFPGITKRQPYFTEPLPHYPYSHELPLNRYLLALKELERENQYYSMSHDYPYHEQLQNHRPQQFQTHINPPSWSPKDPYMDMTTPNQFKPLDQPIWDNGFGQSYIDHSNLGFSSYHVFEQARKQKYPEKMLTRSLGLNSLRSQRLGSYGGNESTNHNGNVHLKQSVVIDCLRSPSTSHDGTKFAHNYPRQRPQRYNSVDEYNYGQIYNMAKDQQGCRLLQQKFSEGTQQEHELIYNQLIDHVVELMMDPFGNYLIQKIMDMSDEDQMMQILRVATRKHGDLVRMCCNQHGTRSVQKLVDCLKTPEQFSIVGSALKPGIMIVMKDGNGTHAAQRCIAQMDFEYCKFIHDTLVTHCLELSTDRFGCCVIQKWLQHFEGERRRGLVSQIIANALVLSQDAFGNYVVQFIFEIQDRWAEADVIAQLKGHFGDLSIQKYSSNVVEKCLKFADEEHRSRVIEELINNPRLDQIMQDPYGNYVTQAALRLSKGTLHAALIDAIRPHVPTLRTSPYGKKVISSHHLKK